MENRFKNWRLNRDTSRLALCVVAASLLLGLAAWSRAPEPSTTAAANLTPEQVLREMSETPAKSRRFTFKVTRHLDAALVEGQEIAEDAQIEISVARPRHLHGRRDTLPGTVLSGPNCLRPHLARPA